MAAVKRLALASLIALTACGQPPSDAAESWGIGSPVDSATLRAIDIDAGPDGAGLPAGNGTSREGAAVFAARCASCHSLTGERLAGPALAGLPAPGISGSPRGIRYYWPYAPTLYDYIRRAMPPGAAGSLSAGEVYSLSAFILARNGLWADSAILDRASLAALALPARSQFFVDTAQW